MVHDPAALKRLRECWRCDCDGVSHEAGAYVPSAMERTVRGIKDHVKTVTGHEPLTCPWRSLYEPLVGEAMKIAGLADKGLADAYLGDDPPAILVDAAHAYLCARDATQAHDMEQERKERESKRRG